MIPTQNPGRNFRADFFQGTKTGEQMAGSGCFSRALNRLVTCFSGERAGLADQAPCSTAYGQPRKVSTLAASGVDEEGTGGLEAKNGWGKTLGCEDITQALSMLLGVEPDEESLASGGEGDVYVGVNQASKHYAIKVIRKQRQLNLKDTAGEFCCLQLARHPNIATVLALILHNSSNKTYVAIRSLNDIPPKMYTQYRLAAVISELIKGCTLHKALNSTKGVLGRECSLISRWRQTCNMGRQLVKALSDCRAHNIIYRDLKPDNVMMVDTGNNEPDNPDIKLIDFGLAKNITRLGRTYSICGAPFYFSPEIVLDASSRDRQSQNGHTYSVDLWGLGVMLAVMLTGNDLRSLCCKPEDDEFIKLNSNKGFSTPQSYIYTLGFARMNETKKKQILLDAMPVEGNSLPQINALVNLILGLTKETPTERTSLIEAGRILDEIINQRP